MGSTAVPSIAAAASSGVVFKGRPPAEKANGFNTFEWPALGSALFGISRLQDQPASGSARFRISPQEGSVGPERHLAIRTARRGRCSRYAPNVPTRGRRH